MKIAHIYHSFTITPHRMQKATFSLIMQSTPDYVMMMKYDFFLTEKVKASTCLKHWILHHPSLFHRPKPAGHFPFYVWLRARAAFYSLGHLRVRNPTHLQRESARNPLNLFILPSGRSLHSSCSDNVIAFCLNQSAHGACILAGVMASVRCHSPCWGA